MTPHYAEFANAAMKEIAGFQVGEAKAAGKLRVSTDWPLVDSLWGVPVRVDSSLSPQTIIVLPHCRHLWSRDDGYVSKVLLGPPDDKGWQAVTYGPPMPAPRCLLCGEVPDPLDIP